MVYLSKEIQKEIVTGWNVKVKLFVLQRLMNAQMVLMLAGIALTTVSGRNVLKILLNALMMLKSVLMEQVLQEIPQITAPSSHALEHAIKQPNSAQMARPMFLKTQLPIALLSSAQILAPMIEKPAQMAQQ